ncbi:hypothetical protein ILUMI_25121, partial [Ignelater luminosus]
MYLAANNLVKDTDERKIALFLTFAGDEAVNVFNTLNLTEKGKESYSKAVAAFDEYCKPRNNETYNRF